MQDAQPRGNRIGNLHKAIYKAWVPWVAEFMMKDQVQLKQHVPEGKVQEIHRERYRG